MLDWYIIIGLGLLIGVLGVWLLALYIKEAYRAQKKEKEKEKRKRELTWRECYPENLYYDEFKKIYEEGETHGKTN